MAWQRRSKRHLFVAEQLEWESHLTYYLRLLLWVNLKHLPNRFNGPTSFIENILQYSSPYRILLKHQKISAKLHSVTSQKIMPIFLVYDDFISVAGACNLLSCENYCGEVQMFEQSCPFQGTILTLCWKDWGNHKNKICQSFSSDAYQDILQRSLIYKYITTCPDQLLFKCFYIFSINFQWQLPYKRIHFNLQLHMFITGAVAVCGICGIKVWHVKEPSLECWRSKILVYDKQKVYLPAE